MLDKQIKSTNYYMVKQDMNDILIFNSVNKDNLKLVSNTIFLFVVYIIMLN